MTRDQFLLVGGAFVLLLLVAMLLERASPRKVKHRNSRPAKRPPGEGDLID